MRSRPLPERIAMHDAGWCLRSNGLCAHRGALRFFAATSRLGDGLFWYALMLALVAVDGPHGLRVCVHLAATGLATLLLYKWLKRWTRRPRPRPSSSALAPHRTARTSRSPKRAM